MKKKLISLLLVLALLCTVLPSALAASLPFTDVPDGIWYHNAVEFAYENQLFNGTSATTFSPEGSMTRAMLVTVLWRQAGSPESDAAVPFTDLRANWYRAAVRWAYENEVVNGITATTFVPDRPVTREQMVTILYRYANRSGYDCSATNRLNAFYDRDTISNFAKDAFHWAVGAGIINGVSSTRLDPAGTASRAQVATIVMRFVNLFDDDPTNDPVPPEDPDEAPEPPVPAASVDSIQVSGKSYRLGMTVSQLTQQAGQPSEKLTVLEGYTWYVYGADTYQHFFLAGVYGDQVVSLCASGPGFSYMGHKMGDAKFSVDASSSCSVDLMFDQNDSNIFHCVQLTSKSYSGSYTVSATKLANESKVDFHLVNAFRVYHGAGVLSWSDKAATSARLHSADMAANNYFSHTSLDGRSPSDRMEAQGINWWSCGENIAAGYYSGVEAHNSWVNSSGHRDNMLTPYFTNLGVGFAYQSSATYRIYATENFFS